MERLTSQQMWDQLLDWAGASRRVRVTIGAATLGRDFEWLACFEGALRMPCRSFMQTLGYAGQGDFFQVGDLPLQGFVIPKDAAVEATTEAPEHVGMRIRSPTASVLAVEVDVFVL